MAIILMLGMFAIFLTIEHVKNGKEARELKMMPSQLKSSPAVRLGK